MNKFIDFADKLHRKARVILSLGNSNSCRSDSQRQTKRTNALHATSGIEGLIVTLELYF